MAADKKEHIEKVLHEAFDSGPKSLISTDQKGEKYFITQTHGYYDIQAYVYTGMQFPSTDEEFSKKYTPATFDPMKDVDAKLYDDTKSTVVKVSQSCNSFKNKTMGRLWSSPRLASEFCDQAILQLKDNKNSFLSHWRTLMDPKYKDPKSWDDEFRSALTRCKVELMNIRRTSDEKKKDMEDLVKDLTAFLVDTSAYKNDVDNIDTRYHKTKFHKDGKEYDNCIKYFNAEIDAARAEMTTLLEEMNKDEETVKKNKVEPSFWHFLGLGGWIDAVVRLQKAKEAAEDWNKKRGKWVAESTKTAEIVRLTETVTSLCAQFKRLTDKMQSAIDAMHEVILFFNKQTEHYSALISELENMKAGINSDDFDMRATNIEDGINNAVETFHEIKKLAAEFQSAALLNSGDPHPHSH